MKLIKNHFYARTMIFGLMVLASNLLIQIAYAQPAMPAVNSNLSEMNSTNASANLSEDLPSNDPNISDVDVQDAKDIVIDFDKMQLKSFIEFISQLKHLNYLPNPDVNNVEISPLTIKDPLTVDQAYNVFLTALDASGFRHVKVGDLYKVVKKDGKYPEPMPVYIGRSSLELPDSDLTVRFVTFFKNLALSDVEPLMKSLLNSDAGWVSLPAFNGAMITDRCFNIKSAMRIANELDNCGQQEVVSLIRMEDINVVDVKALLDDLIKKPEGSSALARLLTGVTDGGVDYFSSQVKIIAEERTNTLILLGSSKALAKIEDFVRKFFINSPFSRKDSPFGCYECQYCQAEDIKAILDEVTTSSNTALKQGGIRAGVRFFAPMKIQADRVGNRLIFSCQDKSDLAMITKIAADLDKPQPQVAIETLIVEISQTNDKNLGGQIRNRSKNSPLPGVEFQNSHLGPIQFDKDSNGVVQTLVSNLSNVIDGMGKGSVILSFGKEGDIWSIIKALESVVNVSIISRPFITVANRTPGTASTGETRTIVSERAVPDDGRVTDATAASYTRGNAKTEVSYTPMINPEGLINLKVKVSISDFRETGDDILEKELTTNVTVGDGQVLALGGFVKTKSTESGGKTPLFGDIPVLRWLFTSKLRSTEKSYIFIFACPTIVKPRTVPGMGTYTKMKMHEAYNIIEEAVEMQKSRDPIHNWFFNRERENYSHKVLDFGNARYQPTTVDIKNDPYYRSSLHIDQSNDQALTRMTSEPIKESLTINPDTFEQRVGVRTLSSTTQPQDQIREMTLSEKKDRLRQLVNQQQPTIPINAPVAMSQKVQTASSNNLPLDVEKLKEEFNQFLKTKMQVMPEVETQQSQVSQLPLEQWLLESQEPTANFAERPNLEQYLAQQPQSEFVQTNRAAPAELNFANYLRGTANLQPTNSSAKASGFDLNQAKKEQLRSLVKSDNSLNFGQSESDKNNFLTYLQTGRR